MMIGLVATSLLASCKKNNNDNNGGTANGQGFRATTEQGAGNNTRTHIDGLNPTAGGTSQVLWDDADLIKVRNNAGTVLTYQLTEGANTPNGTFYTGEDHDDFFQPNYTAIYPAFNADDVANTITGEGTAQFTLPATQSYVENSFAKGAMPMMAVSDNQTLPFKNVLGGLCFPIVGNLTVKKIVLTSANTADRLNGVFDANYNNGEPTLTHNTDDGDNGDNTITLMCNPAVQLDATNPTDFIVMVPPGMLESGFAITAYGETDNVIYTKSTSTAPGADFIQRKLIRKTNANLEVVEYTVSLSANPTAGGTVTGGGTYYYGTSCMVTATANSGYAFVNWTEGTNVVSTSPTYTFTVDDNHDLVANFRTATPPGTLSGLYSVSSSKKVYFSEGNLQYQASTNTWRFAPNQYDYIAAANSNISSSYSGWIDLFGWGTSGYQHGATNWQPWNTSGVSDQYNPYNSSTANLYDSDGRADWGYNAIDGICTEHSGWRTLSKDEWVYVLNTRDGIRYAKAIVAGKNGLILLPDNWTASTYPLNSTNSHTATFGSNNITAETWVEYFEANGAVFLPAAGDRYLRTVSNIGGYGNYWSSTRFYGEDYEYKAFYLRLFNERIDADYDNYRSYGYSVRLVLNAN